MKPGDVLAGRYRLDAIIGAGGVGRVWRAQDTILEREVAIKLVDLTAHHDDPEAIARFRREAVATAGLSHPNVVTVFDSGTDGEVAYIVMQLLSGPVLRSMIHNQGQLSYAEGIPLAKKIAEGLAAAHAIGITHRDIKPGNIMLNDGEPNIVDFGIARLEQDGNQTLTLPSMAVGTPAYIAPEQAMGQSATPASDMYSFGCLMLAIFTGKPPFEAEAPIALARAHISERPPQLVELRPDAPEALNDLVAHLLAKDPVDRPSAETVVAELTRIEEDPLAKSSLGILPDDLPPRVPARHPIISLAEVPGSAKATNPLSWILAGLLILTFIFALIKLRPDSTPTQPPASSVTVTQSAVPTVQSTAPAPPPKTMVSVKPVTLRPTTYRPTVTRSAVSTVTVTATATQKATTTATATRSVVVTTSVTTTATAPAPADPEPAQPTP